MKPLESSNPPPLVRHERLRTGDVDEACAEVGRAFCPHRLEPVDPAGRLNAHFRSARVGNVGLNYLDYGAAVRIVPGELERFFLVQIPLAGHARIACGTQEIVSDPTLASVPSPIRPLDMHWSDGNPQLIVWIDRAGLEHHLGRMLDRRIKEPIEFDLAMHVADPAMRSWVSVVDLLRSEIECGGPLLAEPRTYGYLEQLLMSQLLLAQPNNYLDQLRSEPAAAPRAVRRAKDLIEDHAAEALTVEDVAEAVGLSVRALQKGFQQHLNTTPTAYLRDIRLARTHAELSTADPASRTVTDVALRWGFLHLGRFSVEYRRRYGETPSQTLRR